MELYSRELKSFEDFCQTEFRTLFNETTQSVVSSLDAVNAIQKPLITKSDKTAVVAVSDNVQFESVKYSYFSGGKRFRPMLSFACAQYLNIPAERVFPWAMAIEMIHTYSLIHDDLPCMDNDDLRRGKPTNHKVYGEAIALLAGDSLLTEAFAVLAKFYSDSGPSLGALVKQLANVSGLNGMILGQYYDMTLETQKIESITHLNQIHLLKTGALIAGAFIGPALLKNMSAEQLKSMRDLGLLLGYAFQVKDDILDADQDKGLKKNLMYHLETKEKLTQFLELIHQNIHHRIDALDKQLKTDEGKNRALTQFLEWNMGRDK